MQSDSRPEWKKHNDEAEQIHEYSLSVSNRRMYIHSNYESNEGDPGTDWRMANTFIKNLHILESSGDDPIDIHQFNVGGDEESGYAIYDAIKSCPCTVTMITHGVAASMGSIIPQAADVRVTMPSCCWMIHKGSTGIGSRPRTEARQWAKWEDFTDRRMLAIYAEACQGAEMWEGKDITSVMSSMSKMLNGRGDWFMSATEAVNYGFCDELYV
tara:strand:+ start:1207 stop:1845 length:639 start_codon:yes stop_codon:yes gene_type:complete